MYKSLSLKIISILFLIALIFGVFVPSSARACACGMLVPENNRQISMAGERGVVVFDGLKGTEQMAVDFRLEGSSNKTALVVPTPVKSDISQIKQVVFEDLADLINPPRDSGLDHGLNAVGSSKDSVEVLERKTVGNFEIAVLKTNSYKALFDWTKNNGFYLEPEAESPVRTFIDKGFILNVIKLKKDADTSNINPLKFTFKTKTIFYPLMEIKDSRDDEKDKSLDLYLITDGKITDPSIISSEDTQVVNQEISTDTLIGDISRTNESGFSNLDFTAGKYFATYISTFDYSADESMVLGLGNPGSKNYQPLGLDYSQSAPNYIPNWVYPSIIAVIIIIVTPMVFVFSARKRFSLKKRGSKITTPPIAPLNEVSSSDTAVPIEKTKEDN